MDDEEKAWYDNWDNVLLGGVSSAIDGWIGREFSEPEVLPPQPAPDRLAPAPTGFQIDQKTLLIAGGVLALVIVVAVVV